MIIIIILVIEKEKHVRAQSFPSYVSERKSDFKVFIFSILLLYVFII